MKKGDNIKIFCQDCQQKTNHKVLELFKEEYKDDENFIYGEIDYMIVSCCGCERVSFATLSMNSEDIELDDDNKEKYVETIYQYPIPRIGFDNLIDDYNIPESIRLVYKQTCNSIANNDYLIAGIGLRTIIEAICLYEQILGKTLKTKITNLFKSGVISKRDCDILHAIRFIGNEATHMIQSPTKEQVSIVIRIVENLFENKYCLCEKTNDNLDMPFNDYNNFYNYVISKLRVLEIDKDLCIDDIWEKGKNDIMMIELMNM